MEHAVALSRQDVVWALGSLCSLSRIPFDAELLGQQLPPPYTLAHLIQAGRDLGFKVDPRSVACQSIHQLFLPCVALVHEQSSVATAAPGDTQAAEYRVSSSGDPITPPPATRLVLIVKADADRLLVFEAGSRVPTVQPLETLARGYTGQVIQFARATEPVTEVNPNDKSSRPFGFRWFIPELMKHRTIWRDVLLASLMLQLLGLATPLFTQTIIDKVVVHQTFSTMNVIGVALFVCMVFSALMSWVRQYLILHTGNRVDAVLGTHVFEHLIKLPLRYFEHRPTGVVVARLQGVETIREFISSAAITFLLDLPFLFIFLGIMLYYSVPLSLIAVVILGAIVLMSLAIAPRFRERLNHQFLVGARNQAFLTEYLAGIETVKSLQMEPQLASRYGDYVANYLHAGFRTKQLGNTYNTLANTLEQLMTLAILWMGATLVMAPQDPGSAAGTGFTIGMLVAFQMFAGRLSQPLLRLVGLWQQFQQAHIAVQRLGDLMNAPPEPYALIPVRESKGAGQVELRDVAFRYDEHLPYLYRGFTLTLKPGQCMALLGPSGSGKSTLAKLLQGFYLPSDGQVLLDGRDIRYLSANELRRTFGVVPQETVLFSGTIYDNVIIADPDAGFEHVITACKMAEIHAVIEQLPKGYQTEIGERGVGLSGGQKQRLAIARALLKRPKILIFDEATSSLDAATAEQLAKTINALKGTISALFITHHLPRGLHVDEVVRIGEPGEKQQLSVVTTDRNP